MRNAWMILAGLALVAGPALAQDSEDAVQTGTESAGKPAARTPVPLAGKRLACKETGTKNGLRGAELQDQMQVCLEEAKLGCLKDAIAQKARGKDRREFILKCMDTAG